MNADALSRESAIVRGNVTIRPVLAIGLPFIIAVGGFVAFIAFAVLQDGTQFTIRAGGARVPVSAEVGRLGFAPFIGLATGTLVLLTWAMLRQFGRRYALTRRAFVLSERGRRIVLPLVNVTRVHIESDVIGWRFVFVTEPPLDVILDASACRTLVPALRHLGVTVDADEELPRDYPGLALGEQVLWRQWRGPAAVAWPMWLGLFVLALPPLFFAWFGWGVLSRDIFGGAAPLLLGLAKLVMTLMAALIMALGPTILFFKLAPDAAVDALGTLAVTDRRLVWLAFRTGEVRREIAGDRLVEAVQLGPRWISLTVRDDEKPEDVFDLDLRGIRRPAQTLTVLGKLIHSHGP